MNTLRKAKEKAWDDGSAQTVRLAIDVMVK